jgi:hypothetical protein
VTGPRIVDALGKGAASADTTDKNVKQTAVKRIVSNGTSLNMEIAR